MARNRAYRSRPGNRQKENAWQRAYDQRPEVRQRRNARQKAYDQRPEVKQRRRERARRPENVSKKREYEREKYHRNPEEKKAQVKAKRRADDESFQHQAKKRRTYQYGPINPKLTQYPKTMSKLIEDEDRAFIKTMKGIKQFEVAIDGITIYQLLREAEAVVHNEIATNFFDPVNGNISVLPQVARDAFSVASLSKEDVTSLIQHVRSNISETKPNSFVVIIWIRTSPETDLLLRRFGFDIDIYPFVCYAKDSSRHTPFECAAFHQLLQVICDPNLEDRTVLVLANDPFRFCQEDEDRRTMESCVANVHTDCRFKTVLSFFSDTSACHEIFSSEYKSLTELSKSASNRNVVKAVESLGQYECEQGEVFSLARKKRSDLDRATLCRIRESYIHPFTDEQIDAVCAALSECYSKVCNGYPVNDAVIEIRNVVANLGIRLPSDLCNRKLALLMRTSGKYNPTFADLGNDVKELMGEHASSGSPIQFTNCVSVVEVLYGRDALESRNVATFHDPVTSRDSVVKRSQVEFILFNMVSNNELAVINEYSRLGSDPVAVGLVVNIIQSCGVRLIAASQLDYKSDDLINVEGERRMAQSIIVGQRKADLEELDASIEGMKINVTEQRQ